MGVAVRLAWIVRRCLLLVVPTLLIVAVGMLPEPLALSAAETAVPSTPGSRIPRTPRQADVQMRVVGAPAVFRSFSLSQGLATDDAGNVFVTSDAVTTTLLSKFSPIGAPLGQITIGGFMVGSLGYLAVDPGTGLIWDLTTQGDLILVNPDTLGAALAVNVRQIPTDVEHVFDYSTGTVRSFVGYIDPSSATFGDIALFRHGERLDVFLTGVNGNTGFPFVTRIRFGQNLAFESSRVIAASLFQPPPGSNNVYPRGVAVSPSGVVMTSSHVQTGPATSLEFPIAFSYNFPEGGGFPPRIVGSFRPLTSFGMTSDADGNFYIATNSAGALGCGAGSAGALVVIPFYDLHAFACGLLGRVIATSRDVEVSPGQDAVYMTTDGIGVVRFPLDLPSPPPTPANDAFDVASTIPSLPARLTVNTQTASVEPGEPIPTDCDGQATSVGKTVWYAFTPRARTAVTLSTELTQFDTIVAVYTGQTLASLTRIACNDNAGPAASASIVTFTAEPDTRYFVQVGGFQDQAGALDLQASGTPAELTPTPTPSSTPTPIPTPTPTPTATLPGSAPPPSGVQPCSPRPPVTASVQRVAADRLTVTVSATGTQNALKALRFGAASNALIDVGASSGQPGGFDVSLPPGTSTISFVVRRPSTTLATTVPLVVVDDCGEWPTFVGAGTGV
jgi:hypothetical protein